MYFVARLAVFAFGLVVLAFGITLSINAELGISPVSVLPYTASMITGIQLGLSFAIFYIIFIAVQIILLRKRYRPLDLLQIVVSFVMGYLVQGVDFIMAGFTLQVYAGYAGQLAMMVLGIVLTAFGVALYIEARLVNLPPEGLVVAVVDVFPSRTFAQVKVFFDISLVILSVVLALVFAGTIYGVREGTILSGLLVGKFVPVSKKVIVPVLGKMGYYQKS